MQIKKIISALTCFVMLSFQPAFAALITGSATNISGTTWETRYTITNNLSDNIYWFTLFFQADQYSNLEYVRTAEFGPEWDIFTFDPFFTDDGFVDAYSFGAGIAVGQSVSNFVVRYTYLGANLPRLQQFEVYDASLNFDDALANPLAAGDISIAAVPEPSSLYLFGLGLLAFAAYRIKQLRLN
ncbi:PEP-CTERM sorting domain-containing protein [Rheinheimera sp. UJ63]|uniref:PEP-CTERM sorting domain-containing protein n=1 Tax=Rheinheimera sp. UJ63 TaxID=2910157 RepID=UPI001F171D6A|nr:PEP-CTERM sorting domain-containing protein [Rheinheimera sp. UJ63]MCF4009173.1 PEP-CTERM sorting domain-containing protein [Rheinheimera sp. UJ63]